MDVESASDSHTDDEKALPMPPMPELPLKFCLEDYCPELWDLSTKASQEKLKRMRLQLKNLRAVSNMKWIDTPELSALLPSMIRCAASEAHVSVPAATPTGASGAAANRKKSKILPPYSMTSSPRAPLLYGDVQGSFEDQLAYRRRYAPHKRSGVSAKLMYDRATSPLPDQDRVFQGTSLEFESRFESGNLFRAIQIDTYEYDLMCNNDVNSLGKMQWFFFRVRNMQPGVGYKFNLLNMEKKSSAFCKGMIPVLLSSKLLQKEGTGWHRARAGKIGYYPNHWRRVKATDIAENLKNCNLPQMPEDDGCGSDDEDDPEGCGSDGLLRAEDYYYTLSFTLMFPAAEDTCYVAHFYPYTYTHLVSFLDLLQKASYPECLVRQPLALSHGGQMCELLTITDFATTKLDRETPMSSSALAVAVIERPVVVLSCRVHPGEANASWIMQGVLWWLCGHSNRAQLLRKRVVFKIIPMLNPDGVVYGNYRCSLMGIDLNRHWHNALPHIHPTTAASKRFILALGRSAREVILYVDIHGHSVMTDWALYGCDPSNSVVQPRPPSGLEQRVEATHKWLGVVAPGEPGKERLFPYLLSRHADQTFSLSACTYHVSKVKLPSARVVVWRNLRLWSSYTLEASFFAPSGGSHKGYHFDTHDFASMGRALCMAVNDLVEPNHKVARSLYAKVKAAVLDREKNVGKPKEASATPTITVNIYAK